MPIFLSTRNPNNPVVILRSRWSPYPATVPIEGAVLFELVNPVIDQELGKKYRGYDKRNIFVIIVIPKTQTQALMMLS